MSSYIAIIRKARGTSYGVDFPDFPGLVSGGESLDAALVNARDGLALHIEGLLEDGDVIPAPSLLDEILVDPHNRDGAATLIQAPSGRGRAVRVQITMDEHLLSELDRVTSNRSGFIDAALRSTMTGHHKAGRILAAGKTPAKRVVKPKARA